LDASITNLLESRGKSLILKGKHGLINVLVEPKLQLIGARTLCTIQMEKHQEVLHLGSKLMGDVRFVRHDLFPFTGYVLIDELVVAYRKATFSNLRMHEGDISPDPAAYYFIGWSEDEDEHEEDSSVESGWVLPKDREDIRYSFPRTLDVIIFYPLFAIPKQLQNMN
jgi:hypothetical protein